ncbi:hypothetical protein RND81_08G118100 [Saponaria officinalis]|uniref:Retrovirus-related Pol polyprotein from transposon TNT 1-94-like beta-barrel domain-containing protein n=1 Tax=Saponaria officinalis TaxID=3572 RepID=A0AAW1J6C0_SAPOF
MKAFSDKSTPLSSINFASTICSSQVYTPPISQWTIDTGAFDHMTHDINLLYDICSLPSPTMTSLPNSTLKQVHKSGKVTLTPAITLENVLLVPDFKHNLLSVELAN